ncbi:MAG: response regulator [Deltaproteobacteria bacterium]|nr:response regulator [Deltaproteobacteria bacterium]
MGNLLSNAAKFSSQGSRTRITLGRDVPAAQASIEVWDGGAGIAPDILPHLFEAFTQADETLARSAGGLGLGLSVVRGLVDLHGGSVSASSDGLGKGARFTIRLPLATVEPPAVKAGPKTMPRTPRRVLVIEDNLDAADSLRDVLEFAGHRVATAHDGPAGIEKAREFLPDVVLCDIGLPGMDGYEVARAFRADARLRQTYIVALSGYALPQDLAEAREAGFDMHLAKPANLEDLEQALAGAPASRD